MKKRRVVVISSVAVLLTCGFLFSWIMSPVTSCPCILQGCHVTPCQTDWVEECYETTRIVFYTGRNTTKLLAKAHKERTSAESEVSSCREHLGSCAQCPKEEATALRMTMLILILILFVGFIRWRFPEMFHDGTPVEHPGDQLPAYEPPPPYRPSMKPIPLSPPSDGERCSGP